MTSFSQNDHLNSYQKFVSYFEIEIDCLKQDNLYHDGDSKYENNSFSFQNSFRIELNAINISLNEKENLISDLDCSTIKNEDSKDSEQLSIIEILKDKEPLKSEDDHYPERKILYLEEKKSFPQIIGFHPKKIINKSVRTKNKKNTFIRNSLSHKRKLFEKKSLPKFKYKKRLLNAHSIKLVLIYLPKIKKIFDFFKNSNKNNVPNENIIKQLIIIKSIIRKRFNYLKINRKFKLNAPDDFYESLYGNNDYFKELIKRKNISFKMTKLRKRKKLYVYKYFKNNLIPNSLYQII